MNRFVPLLLGLVALAHAQGGSKCTCRDGNGSYLYLRCPKRAPADPDPCPAAHHGLHPGKALPKPWNDMCWQSGRMRCFLRRHGVSWNIQCSLCAKKKCCPFGNWHNCPECHGEAKGPPTWFEDSLLLAKEQEAVGGKAIEVATSPHFVLVCDLPSLKIATAGGAPRMAGKHEILHLFLQRAEMARRDFEEVFGSAWHGRSAMVIVRSDNTRRKFAQLYCGTAGVSVVRGYGSGKTWPAMSGNGLFISGKNDDQLHFTARHLIGHLLISTYVRANPFKKYLPQWVDKGCAHWLSKLHPRAKNFATFCQHEGVGITAGGGRSGGGRGGGRGGGFGGGGGGGGGPSVSGSGARWEMKAQKIARKGPRKDPVEAMFQASTAKEMNFEKHVRAWSWYEVFTQEERGPFVDFIQRLRNAEEARAAAKSAWGQPPEMVDDRWREFVLGKRRDAAATAREKEKESELGEATRRELDDIAKEEDLQLLASRIRGLEECRNIKTARLLVTLMDQRNSDRVREVIALILDRTEDADVLAYLRGDGYQRADKLARATLCRAFGVRRDEKALPLLRKAMASDSFWLVKANAARALALLGDRKSLPALTKMAATASLGKLRIAGMDGLALFGADAADSVPAFERNLMHRSWQVKVATCDAFRAIGSTKAVEMLIGRLDAEGGRVHDEINRSLKALTGLNQEMRAEQWRKWWTKMQKFSDLEKRMKEELEKEKNKPAPRPTDDRRYAKKKEPTYYGIKVYARTVGYVLDVSQSMTTGFRVAPSWEERLGRKYTASTRIGVSKQELSQAIQELDPRTRLNLYFFNNRARAWQSTPVAAGSMGSNAVSAVQNIGCSGQTNYYDALRLVFKLDDNSPPWNSAFTDTPDTLFFLTDGHPTDGEITKADELLPWFNERNRFARLRVHVIAMGTMDVDTEFLRKFAQQNGGKFLHVTGTY
ncbi:MAG: HEAT repeat domain-containing protein [Planctomycetota bacterium]|jgi:HEAT repeat protein